MKIRVACDVCGDEMLIGEAHTDLDGHDLCSKHSLGYGLKDLIERRERLRAELLPQFEKLHEMEAQIERLQRNGNK